MSESAYCPECDTRIRLVKKVKEGQYVTCQECQELLEVISLNPIELTWAMEEETESYSKSGDYYEDDFEDDGRFYDKW